MKQYRDVASRIALVVALCMLPFAACGESTQVGGPGGAGSSGVGGMSGVGGSWGNGGTCNVDSECSNDSYCDSSFARCGNEDTVRIRMLGSCKPRECTSTDSGCTGALMCNDGICDLPLGRPCSVPVSCPVDCPKTAVPRSCDFFCVCQVCPASDAGSSSGSDGAGGGVMCGGQSCPAPQRCCTVAGPNEVCTPACIVGPCPGASCRVSIEAGIVSDSGRD